MFEFFLKGLKHDTSKGYRTWEIWLDKEIISKHEFMATVTIFKVTCELWSFKINKYIFVLSIYDVVFKIPMEYDI